MGMWVYVHTFPDGYRPQPQVVLDAGAVVRVQKVASGATEHITRVVVEQGTVRTTNVTMTGEHEMIIPATVDDRGKSVPVRLLAPSVVLADTKQPDKFGIENVPVVIKPGVKVEAADVQQTFNPAEFNPDHTRYIARSEKAKPMAVNMYSGFWTLVVCVAVLISVSLFTEPKPEGELTNLVMGLTPLPDDGPCPWYYHPYLWASLVGVALVAINIIFW